MVVVVVVLVVAVETTLRKAVSCVETDFGSDGSSINRETAKFPVHDGDGDGSGGGDGSAVAMGSDS